MNVLLVACLWAVSPPTPRPSLATFLPVRQVVARGIVGDIESHLPAGNVYGDADRITHVHEGTHGINSALRNAFGFPGLYMLGSRAVLIAEPQTTLATVASVVPRSLRGEVYHLYLVQAQRSWNTEPSYVFDEWSAYANGATARYEHGIQDRGETVRYAGEFIVYSFCVPYASGSSDPQMRAFLMWHTERVLWLSARNGISLGALQTLRVSADAGRLRAFMRGYCGTTWTSRQLGF